MDPGQFDKQGFSSMWFQYELQYRFPISRANIFIVGIFHVWVSEGAVWYSWGLVASATTVNVT